MKTQYLTSTRTDTVTHNGSLPSQMTVDNVNCECHWSSNIKPLLRGVPLLEPLKPQVQMFRTPAYM